MTKFGLFKAGKVGPTQQYEGDLMIHDGEYVKILVTAKNDNDTGRTVAAIRMDKGDSVKELKPGEGI